MSDEESTQEFGIVRTVAAGSSLEAMDVATNGVPPAPQAAGHPSAGSEDSVATVPPPAGNTVSAWVLAISLAACVASFLQIGLHLSQRGFFVEVLFGFICTAAALIDFAERRIPNVLTYPAILLGLLLNGLLPPLLDAVGFQTAAIWLGSSGFRGCMLGFGVCAVFGIVSFICRGLGGGDVKLVAAAGAFLGLHQVVPTLANWLVLAGLFGLLNWAVRGSLVARLQVVSQNMLGFLFTRRGFRHIYPFDKTTIPFGIFLLLGWLLSLTAASPFHWLFVNW